MKYGSLFYHVASNIKKQCVDKIPVIVSYVISGGLDSVQRIDGGYYLIKESCLVVHF